MTSGSYSKKALQYSTAYKKLYTYIYINMNDTIDSLYKTMDRAEIAKTPHRKKPVVTRAVVVAISCMIVLVIGCLPLALKMRQRRKEMIVACKFLNMGNNLKFCLDNTNFGNAQRIWATIPSEIGLLTHVSSLSLDGDKLHGTIPSTLGNLINLKTLMIYSTLLTGSLPSTLGNMIQLQSLRMSGNWKLNGTIPSTLGNLNQLEEFWIQYSQLSGSIPSTLGSLVNLTELSIVGNQLTGTIPSAIGNLVQINDLDLSSNQLSGIIPSTLESLTQLRFLGLANNNQLEGTVPSSLCSVSSIIIRIDCDNIACSCCTSYNSETKSVEACSVE